MFERLSHCCSLTPTPQPTSMDAVIRSLMKSDALINEKVRNYVGIIPNIFMCPFWTDLCTIYSCEHVDQLTWTVSILWLFLVLFLWKYTVEWQHYLICHLLYSTSCASFVYIIFTLPIITHWIIYSYFPLEMPREVGELAPGQRERATEPFTRVPAVVGAACAFQAAVCK